MHRLAGPAQYSSNLVLKRGLMDTQVLWRWQRNIVSGNVRRHSGAIVLLDGAGNDTWRWNFREAYPVKWSGPELRAGSAEVAIETLELSHRGLTLQQS